MANHLKFCSCRQCRAGKHTKAGGKVIQAVVRKNRRKTKAALKMGRDTTQTVSAGYTD